MKMRAGSKQHLSKWQLADKFQMNKPILFLPGWFIRVQSTSQLEFESAWWWQKLTLRTCCKHCAQCGVIKIFEKDFHAQQWSREGRCKACNLELRRAPREISKTTAATERHDFHQCRSEVYWQIRHQAKQRHHCDNGEGQRSNCIQCWVEGGVNMVLAYIRANRRSLWTGRRRRLQGESRGFRQWPTWTWHASGFLFAHHSAHATQTLFWMIIWNGVTTNLNRH